MKSEVIVVGGGIGGLTVAALLAARGVDVALFERQSQVGGCVTQFEHLGQSFDPTFGLFSGWQAGGVWERVFSQLPAAPPKVAKLSPNYVVRLPDGNDVPVSHDLAEMEQTVADTFSNCADEAIQFFRAAHDSRADLESLAKTSENFRTFIDAQLSFLAQQAIDTAEPSRLIEAIKRATGQLWEIDGRPQSLADTLAHSFKQTGGHLRLNSAVLRLAYDSNLTPDGIDLLSGERVTATRAIISNLTVWDTYGKLVGISRTPPAISAQLKQMNARGVYQIFMLLDESAVANLPARRIVLASRETDTHMLLNVGSATHKSGSTGKRAATLTTFTEVDDWFAFHQDTTWHEEQDQAMLEKIWARLHAAAPEIAGGAEVFETATPQTYYEALRRKMGMIGSPTPTLGDSRTHLNELFLVGDTAAQTIGLAGVGEQAAALARILLD
jgi:prolycopene isomerase